MSLTNKQQDIINCVEENQTIDNSEIARRVNCSESYVSRIRREYRHLTGELRNVDSDNIWPIFSEPYSVYVDEDYAESNFIEFGEPVEIIRRNLDENGDENQTREITNLRELTNIDFDKEIRALFYATKSIFSKLSGELEEKLQNFEGQEEDDVAIHTQEDLKNYLSYIEEILEIKQKTNDVHIGIGILGGLRSIPSEHNGFTNKNPYFLTYKKLIEKCLKNIDFVSDIRRVNDDIITPERISYVRHGESSPKSNEIIRETILKRKYAQPDCRERYQTDTFVTGPKPSADSANNIIKRNPENIEFHEHKTLEVDFSTSLPKENLKNLIKDKIIKANINIPFGNFDEGENKIQLDCFETEDRLFIMFEGTSVDILIKEETLIAGYPKPVEPVVRKIFDIFSDELGVRIYNSNYKQKIDRKKSDNWILDTNTVYHEIDENIGSSILRTILTNRNIMESKIHIPWIVLYEMNKHKDEGGPDAPIQENGIENLRLLQTLSDYGFVDIVYQDFPNDIPSNVQESSVSDLYLSKYAQENGCVVISGDQRLRSLNRMSGIETVDLYSYANVETVPDIEDHTKERVLSKIGDELKIHSDIIEKLKQEIENAGTSRMEHHNSIPNRQINQEKLPESANDYLQQWTKENELIVYPSLIRKEGNKSENAEENNVESNKDVEKCLMYEKTTVHEVVPTMSVVSNISDNITEFDGDKYLDDELLEKFAKLVNHQGTGKPKMHFYFPVASVISYQSTTTGQLSREGTRLYKLKQIKNSIYTTKELNQADRDDVIHDSVLLAKENDCTLLCGEDEEYLQRIGELIGVNVTVYN